MKNKLIELVDALREELTPNAYIKIANAIQSFSDEQSLPEDEPDLLPFEWPVKDGYEVVTRDGRKVGQLHKFEVEADFPVVGILDGSIEAWTSDGRYSSTGTNAIQDLFLRRVEKKVWVVEWKAHNGFSGKNYFDTINEAQELCKRDEKYHSSATIYEATLKPVK